MSRRLFIAVDEEIDDDPRIAALPSDAARWAWLVTMCKAKKQRPEEARWPSRAHYEASLKRRARYFESFVESGLLVVEEDGGVRIRKETWEKWQFGGSTERVRRWRAGLKAL